MNHEKIIFAMGSMYLGSIVLGTSTGMLIGMKKCYRKNIGLDDKAAIVLGSGIIGFIGGTIPPVGLFLLHEYFTTKNKD